jgi:thymidylate kinase
MKPFTVALIGPDGAGKTTVGRRLEESLPLPARYIYMGWNTEASNVLLPTTRILHAIKRAQKARPTESPPGSGRKETFGMDVPGHLLRNARSFFALTQRVAEEWFRQALTWYHLRRGRIVVFDRHFYSDYVAHDPAVVAGERSMHHRVYGFLLKHIYPKPDLVILLDAPAEDLLERKREGTLDVLHRRREEYLNLRNSVGRLETVDATQPLDAVVREVGRLILDHRNTQRASG